MIETADEILVALLVDAEFMSFVGRYHFDATTNVDAIAILAGNEQVPGVDKIEGLEVIISRVPAMSSNALIGDGCTPRSKTWKIYLVQYSGGLPNAAVEAADRLAQLCPGASYSNVGGGYGEIAGLDQVVVTIPPHSIFSV